MLWMHGQRFGYAGMVVRIVKVAEVDSFGQISTDLYKVPILFLFKKKWKEIFYSNFMLSV